MSHSLIRLLAKNLGTPPPNPLPPSQEGKISCSLLVNTEGWGGVLNTSARDLFFNASCFFY
jgi:hypothetical protein